MIAPAGADRSDLVVVSGMVVGVKGQGGASWVALQYLLGLERLGYDVLFVEQVDRTDPCDLVRLEQVLSYAGFSGEAALVDSTGRVEGMDPTRLRAAAGRAVALLNLSGTLRDPALMERLPARVYLDLDPGFTQCWAEDVDMGLALHTHFATVGLRVGSDECAVPEVGREWIPTPPPVVLDWWSAEPHLRYRGLTSVANWRSYGSVQRDGEQWGQKAHSVRELIELPRHSPRPVALAMAMHADEASDLDALRSNGWRLIDPAAAAGTPERYRRFVRGSWAEIGVAKAGYVRSKSGWFSDRSACYLAAGRPVVAQETGFSRALPTGEGLLAFADCADAGEAIARVEDDYDRHSRAARDLAAAHLDSDVVLTRLLDRVGVR